MLKNPESQPTSSHIPVFSPAHPCSPSGLNSRDVFSLGPATPGHSTSLVKPPPAQLSRLNPEALEFQPTSSTILVQSSPETSAAHPNPPYGLISRVILDNDIGMEDQDENEEEWDKRGPLNRLKLQ